MQHDAVRQFSLGLKHVETDKLRALYDEQKAQKKPRIYAKLVSLEAALRGAPFPKLRLVRKPQSQP